MRHRDLVDRQIVLTRTVASGDSLSTDVVEFSARAGINQPTRQYRLNGYVRAAELVHPLRRRSHRPRLVGGVASVARRVLRVARARECRPRARRTSTTRDDGGSSSPSGPSPAGAHRVPA